jgi:hypothetical protein
MARGHLGGSAGVTVTVDSDCLARNLGRGHRRSGPPSVTRRTRTASLSARIPESGLPLSESEPDPGSKSGGLLQINAIQIELRRPRMQAEAALTVDSAGRGCFRLVGRGRTETKPNAARLGPPMASGTGPASVPRWHLNLPAYAGFVGRRYATSNSVRKSGNVLRYNKQKRKLALFDIKEKRFRWAPSEVGPYFRKRS